MMSGKNAAGVQAVEELIERVAQGRDVWLLESPAFQIRDRDHSEIDEQRFQQVLARTRKRVADERAERRLPVDSGTRGTAWSCLSHLAAQNDQPSRGGCAVQLFERGHADGP